eukprot:g5626.t1
MELGTLPPETGLPRNVKIVLETHFSVDGKGLFRNAKHQQQLGEIVPCLKVVVRITSQDVKRQQLIGVVALFQKGEGKTTKLSVKPL